MGIRIDTIRWNRGMSEMAGMQLAATSFFRPRDYDNASRPAIVQQQCKYNKNAGWIALPG
jgi:hypothetical protein